MVRNNKGFSLIELLAVIIIIGIIAIIVIPSVSEYIQKASDTSYTSFERSMEDAAKSYIMNCETDPSASCFMLCESDPSGQCNLRTPYKVYSECVSSGLGNCESHAYKIKIKLNTMIIDGFIDNMKDPESNNTCNAEDSYVAVTLKKSNSGEYDFSSCLYCGDYYTVGC